MSEKTAWNEFERIVDRVLVYRPKKKRKKKKAGAKKSKGRATSSK